MEPDNRTFGINLHSICVDFCIDEQRFLEKDSHYVQISQNIYNNFLDVKSDLYDNNEEPLYIGVKNSSNSNSESAIYFGRVEPSIDTNNSTSNMCLLPEWVMNKLEIDLYGGEIDIVMIKKMKKIGFIKIKANISEYAKWDNIKELLEEKISQFNCINLGDEIHINNVIFRIVELQDSKGKIVNFGSIVNTTVNLDFDIPDDYVEPIKPPEKKPHVKQKARAETVENKTSHKNSGSKMKTFSDLINEENSPDDGEYKPFSEKGLLLDSKNKSHKKLTREEIASMYERKLNSNSEV